MNGDLPLDSEILLQLNRARVAMHQAAELAKVRLGEIALGDFPPDDVDFITSVGDMCEGVDEIARGVYDEVGVALDALRSHVPIAPTPEIKTGNPDNSAPRPFIVPRNTPGTSETPSSRASRNHGERIRRLLELSDDPARVREVVTGLFLAIKPAAKRLPRKEIILKLTGKKQKQLPPDILALIDQCLDQLVEDEVLTKTTYEESSKSKRILDTVYYHFDPTATGQEQTKKT